MGRVRAFTQRSHAAPRHAPRAAPGAPIAHELQQMIGNLATASLVGIQREEDPDAPAQEAPTLSNPRFAGDRVLARILAGDVQQLSARHNGRTRAVSKVQRALVDLGFDLPLHRVDGRFGSETTTAITEFRSRYGPSPGTVLDAATLAVLDRTAPTSLDERVEHTVEYERLLEDSRLDVTVAFGFSGSTAYEDRGDERPTPTETPSEELAAQEFRNWLTSRGFVLELLGFDDNVEHWKVEHTFVWTDDEGAAHAHSADVWVRLLTPGAGAAVEFGRGLRDDELVIYSGHARYGSGPDFDEKASAAENFRIGIDQAMQDAGRRTRVDEARSHHVAVDEINDLVELTSSPDFDRERYRVLFMKACTSMAYLDEFRSEIGGGGNTDVIGSRHPTMSSNLDTAIAPAEVQIFLGGILDGETVEDIIAAMDASQADKFGHRFRRGLFSMSGVGDNPVSR